MLDNESLKVTLTMLGVSCDERCRQIEAGEFNDQDRYRLADELIEIAHDVRPE